MTKHLKIEVVVVAVVGCVCGVPTFFFQHLLSSRNNSSNHLSLHRLASFKKERRGREKAGVRRTSVGKQWRLRVSLAPPAPAETDGHQTGRKSGREEEEGGGGVEGGGDAGGWNTQIRMFRPRRFLRSFPSSLHEDLQLLCVQVLSPPLTATFHSHSPQVCWDAGSSYFFPASLSFPCFAQANISRNSKILLSALLRMKPVFCIPCVCV